MIPAADLQRWRTPRLSAYMWWCGDYGCDCTQPVVDLIEPNYGAGYPWVHRTRVWEGDFHSQAEPAEMEKQRQDLAVAAVSFGIEVES